MLSSLQYPLERQRELQRKWDRLFRWTLAARGDVLAGARPPTLRHKTSRCARLESGPGRGFPFNGLLNQDARFDELIASLGSSNEIAPIELEAFVDRAGKLIAAASTYQPVGAAARGIMSASPTSWAPGKQPGIHREPLVRAPEAS